MTKARRTLVSLGETPWYHLVNRCVRRAFLCGDDALTGRCYKHRRGWIANRILQLAGVFAIDIAAYAVMSNHYHIVVRVNRSQALGWSDDEVLDRWLKLFSGSVLVKRYLEQREQLTDAEQTAVAELVKIYRRRLYDISWFMRVLNESIARKANQEDGVTGRFWEGRFKSQALLDESALLSVMAYVDLNPVRAGMAETPESSHYTSIARRLGVADPPQSRPVVLIKENTGQAHPTFTKGIDLNKESKLSSLQEQGLMPFSDLATLDRLKIPFSWRDYLDLVDGLGRAVHPKKRGSITLDAPPILARLGISPEALIEQADTMLSAFGPTIGTERNLKVACEKRLIGFCLGMSTARKLFTSKANDSLASTCQP